MKGGNGGITIPGSIQKAVGVTLGDMVNGAVLTAGLDLRDNF